MSANAAMPAGIKSPIIEVDHLKTYLGGHFVHNNLNLTVSQGEILAIAGGSGSGKTTLLRCMLMLTPFISGDIRLFGQSILKSRPSTIAAIQHRWGVMFQSGALFSSLTLLENVAFPLRRFTLLDNEAIIAIARIKINLVGLPADAAEKYPAELSGGMQKRAAVARAIALDPELLFLDEPTAGLDPEGASALDQLVLDLRASLGLTVVMVTHDMDTLCTVPNRIAFLGDGVVLGLGSMAELSESKQPLVQAYFHGARAMQRQLDAGLSGRPL